MIFNKKLQQIMRRSFESDRSERNGIPNDPKTKANISRVGIGGKSEERFLVLMWEHSYFC